MALPNSRSNNITVSNIKYTVHFKISKENHGEATFEKIPDWICTTVNYMNLIVSPFLQIVNAVTKFY